MDETKKTLIAFIEEKIEESEDLREIKNLKELLHYIKLKL